MDHTEITLSFAEVCHLQGIVKEQLKETSQLRARMAADDPFRTSITQHYGTFARILAKLERAEKELQP
jgi:hypothetical protein